MNLKKLIFYLAVTLGTGGVSAFLTMNSMDTYKSLNQPPLAPPPILFPIVWTILFILMGIGAYLVSESDCESKEEALKAFYLQLAINFVWPILFFNLQAFLVAFVWLLILWVAIINMIVKFFPCQKTAAFLQIPYLLWVTFAGYLNIMIYILNR